MTHPSEMHRLAKERQREILAASSVARQAPVLAPRVRARLGWSLIGLGVHLALDGDRHSRQPLHVARH